MKVVDKLNPGSPPIALASAVVYVVENSPDYHAGGLETIKAKQNKMIELLSSLIEDCASRGIALPNVFQHLYPYEEVK